MILTYKELLEKYGDAKLTLVNYYKYSFTFAGEVEDAAGTLYRLAVVCGGGTESIYKWELTPQVPIRLRDVLWMINFVTLTTWKKEESVTLDCDCVDWKEYGIT